jgi:hypothetical protein
MLITYCERCGIRIEEKAAEVTALCPECQAGRGKPSSNTRDSGRISYALLQTPATIMKVVRETLKKRSTTVLLPPV